MTRLGRNPASLCIARMFDPRRFIFTRLYTTSPATIRPIDGTWRAASSYWLAEFRGDRIETQLVLAEKIFCVREFRKI
jgi:hypothetical protein